MNRHRKLRMILPSLLLCVLLFLCLPAEAEMLTCHPGDTDLCDSPGGTVIARLFYNTPVTVLEESGGWRRIAAGSDGAWPEGWIAVGDLCETELPPGWQCGRPATPCANRRIIPVLSAPRTDAEVLGTWERDGDALLTVSGITRDNGWILASLLRDGSPAVQGYIPADSVCLFSSAFVRAGTPARTVNLRAVPSKKGEVLGVYYTGAEAEPLYSFEEKTGWHRVAVGGISGYMMDEFLVTDAADGTGYRSPLLPLKNGTAPLYAAPSGTETCPEHPVLTGADIFCILGKAGSRWHVRILTGEPGTEIIGFADTADLSGSRPVCASLSATVRRKTALLDQPDIVCGKGKKVTIDYFYTREPGTDGAVPLEYWQEDAVWAGVTVYLRGSYGYDEPFHGYLPADALKFDEMLKLPQGMGGKQSP